LTGSWLAGESKPFAEQLANRLGGDVGNEEASLRLRAFLDKVALKPGDDADTVCTCAGTSAHLICADEHSIS
jgi:hypothetical protein